MKVSIKYGDQLDAKRFKFESEAGYPTPTVNIGINQLRTSAGDYLSTEKIITLQGVCYVGRMTAHNDDTPHITLPENKKSDIVGDLFAKASGLQDAIMSRNNQKLFIGVAGGSPLVNDNAAIESISFSPSNNNWSTTVNYEMSFKVYVSGTGGYLLRDGGTPTGTYVSSITDNYKLELLDSDQYIYQDRYAPTYKLSRTLGAVGKRIQAASGAIFHAKQWVAGRERAAPLTGMFRPDEFILYNQERSVEINEPAGSYSITDSFIAKSGNPWIDKWTIETSVDEKFNKKFVLNGSVQGLEPATGIYSPDVLNMQLGGSSAKTPVNPSGRADIYPTATGFASQGYNAGGDFRIESEHQAAPLAASSDDAGLPTTAYHNAVSGYITQVSPESLDRVMLYKDVGETLVKRNDKWLGKDEFGAAITRPIHPIPLSTNEALFPFEGKITYSREFDCRPMPIVSGALVESIKISTTFPSIRTKQVKILGRRLGPIVYEYYNSLNGGTRTVTYEGVFPRVTGLRQYTFPQALLNDMSGILMLYAPPGIGYIKENKQNLNLTQNKVTQTLSWAFNKGTS